ncbi:MULTISPECIES: NUDIX hydrolase [Glycomyces]|uniref:8-oxo-dGTP pyrophosphatase MutT (NUDIX family) n=1 Tax=Glycomyces artemisiae TaxID=1076443 RepID=A0A2T0URF1_9ACTN|nr:NUDIX domain-containing protein [Glycomyces artemisiae]NUQ87017.1 NUDIX domain-containing protein [Glycomyces artemisiae]PRY60511.1 8-oxo-dGTP pyrophosphatase MutT (NUDIX family) [Glycomyces artemisiae]
MSATNEPTRIDRYGARCIVIDEQDAVLFIGRSATADRPARWFLPGGGIDPGETPLDAAVRELFEETGLRVPPADVTGPVARRSFSRSRDGEVFTQDNYLFFTRVPRFQARVSGGDAYEQDLEFKWIGVDELAAAEGHDAPFDPLLHLIKRLVSGDVPAEPLRLEPAGSRTADTSVR